MRRLIAFTTILALSLTSVPLFAASGGRVAAIRQGQTTGTVTGTAQSAQGQTLANYTVRIRNLANGNVAGATTSNAAGQFTFAGLNPGNYAIEIVNAAGQIVATSASVAVAAGATVSVTVTASAAAALGAAGAGAAAAGGAGAASAGVSTALIVTTVAVAAGIVGVVVAVKANASPSR
jgi:hypothetical protein